MKKYIVLGLILLWAISCYAVDVKITDLDADTAPTSDDLTLTVDITSGANKKVTLGNLWQGVLPAVSGKGLYLLRVNSGANAYELATYNFLGYTFPATLTTNGVCYFSNATTLANTALGTEGQIVRAGVSGVPAWSTSTFANTYAKGTFLYNASANTVASLAHPGAANYILTTNAADTSAWLGSSANVLTFLGSANNAAMRSNLELGTMAQQTATDYIPKSLIDAAGDLIIGTADNTVGRLAPGTDTYILTISASTHVPVWAAPAAASAHNILSATHSDTSSASLSRGDILIVQNTGGVNILKKKAIGTVGKVLRTDGTDADWSSYTIALPNTSGQLLVADGTNWAASSVNPLVAAGTQALTADWDAGNYSITGKSFITKKVSGKYGLITLYASNSTDVTGPGFAGASGTVAADFWLQLPPASATTWIPKWGVPVADGDGNLVAPLVQLAYSTDVALGTSDTTISSQNAIKSYVDTGLSGKAATNQTMYIGSTQVAINRATNPLTLEGIILTAPDIGAATGTSLLASGIVDGAAPVTITATSAGTAIGGTYKSGYLITNPTSASATSILTLPTAVAGLQYCTANGAAKTGILRVFTALAPTGTQYIDLDGVLTANTGGLQATAVAGNFACFVGVDATHWKAIPTKGTWTKITR